jgi:glutathione S-transferase
VPRHLTDAPAGHEGLRRKGREALDRLGAYLDGELEGREWCLGARFSVADVYLYMLVGWQSYVAGGYVLGGEPVQSHYRRVGARPAITCARGLDDLDDNLKRYHPDLRGGKPI